MPISPISASTPKLVLAVSEIARLHDAAIHSQEPPALLLALTTLIPCDADALAAARIEAIDREAGTIRIVDDGGEIAEIAVGYHAALTIEMAAGGRRSGPLIQDGHGRPVRADADTWAYANELLTTEGGLSTPPAWSFRSIREGVFAGMADSALPYDAVLAHAAMRPPVGHSIPRRDLIVAQRGVAETWARHIGLHLPSPFAMIDGFSAIGWPFVSSAGEDR